jgi:hypothetical protein
VFVIFTSDVLQMVSSYIGAKDGIYWQLQWYHASKVHSIYLSIIFVIITLPKLLFMHM